MEIKDLIDNNFDKLKNSLESNSLVDEVRIKEVHYKDKLNNATNLPVQGLGKNLEKVESINDRLVYTSNHNIVNDYATFVEETNWATNEISKVSSVINYFDKSRVFSSNYLKDFYKLESSKYFKFIKEYLKPVKISNNAFKTNRNFLNERTSIKLEKYFHSLAKKTSNFLNEEAILTNNTSSISNTSFITQNLINLNHNNKFFYPNTFFKYNKFNNHSSLVNSLSVKGIRFLEEITTITSESSERRLEISSLLDSNSSSIVAEFSNSKTFGKQEFLPVRAKYLDIETINKNTFARDIEAFRIEDIFESINIQKLENDINNKNNLSILKNISSFYKINEEEASFKIQDNIFPDYNAIENVTLSYENETMNLGNSSIIKPIEKSEFFAESPCNSVYNYEIVTKGSQYVDEPGSIFCFLLKDKSFNKYFETNTRFKNYNNLYRTILFNYSSSLLDFYEIYLGNIEIDELNNRFISPILDAIENNSTNVVSEPNILQFYKKTNYEIRNNSFNDSIFYCFGEIDKSHKVSIYKNSLKNETILFKQTIDLTKHVEESKYEKFIYEKDYDIFERYKYYFDEYKKLNVNINESNSSHLLIESSSKENKILGIAKDNTDPHRTVSMCGNTIENVEDSSSFIKIAIHKTTKLFKNLLINDNDFNNRLNSNLKIVQKNLSSISNEDLVNFSVGENSAIISEESIVNTKLNEEFYLNSEYTIPKIDKVLNSKEGIAKGQLEKEDVSGVNEFYKNLLHSSFYKNSVELNHKIFIDINDIFSKTRKSFFEDNQISAFDKLFSSIFTNNDLRENSITDDLVKLFLSLSILKRNGKSPIFYKKNSSKESKIKDTESLNKIFDIDSINKHIFSSENISGQKYYFNESNVLGHFNNLITWGDVDGTSKKSVRIVTATDTDNSNVFDDTISKSDDRFYNKNLSNSVNYGHRQCSSLALCFPYNTINIVGNSKTSSNRRSIASYYDYGIKKLSLDRETVFNNINGTFKNNIITFGFPYNFSYDGINLDNKIVNYCLPKPLLFRKINTLSPGKNLISSIEESSEFLSYGETLAMHYIWDKTYDYKKVAKMDGSSFNSIDEFIKSFSLVDSVPDVSSSWQNLIESGHYPIHEMFHINRKLENRLFENIQEESSLLNSISNAISIGIDILDEKYDFSSVSSLEDALTKVNESKDLCDLTLNIVSAYSEYYRLMYDKFIKTYFYSINEDEFIQNAIYDYKKSDKSILENSIYSNKLYADIVPDIQIPADKVKDIKYENRVNAFASDVGLKTGESIERDEYDIFANYYNDSTNNSFRQNCRAYCYLTIAGLLDFYAKPSATEVLSDGSYSVDVVDGNINTSLIDSSFKYVDINPYYLNEIQGVYDLTLSLSYEKDEEFMFQENSSLLFYPENMLNKNSKLKTIEYLKSIENLKNIKENISDYFKKLCEKNKENYYAQQNIDYFSFKTALYENIIGLSDISFIFENVNMTLKESEAMYALSIDIISNYMLQLSEDVENINKNLEKIKSGRDILNTLLEDNDEPPEIGLMLSKEKFVSDISQNLHYLNLDKLYIDNKINKLEKQEEKNILEDIEITQSELDSLNKLVEYFVTSQIVSRDLNLAQRTGSIVKISLGNKLYDSSNIRRFCRVKISKNNLTKNRVEEYNYSYSPLIKKFRFRDNNEIFGNIGLVDLSNNNLGKNYDILSKEEFLSTATKYFGNDIVDEEGLAEEAYFTNQMNTVCSAYLEIMHSLVDNNDILKNKNIFSLNTYNYIIDMPSRVTAKIFETNLDLDFEDKDIGNDQYENFKSIDVRKDGSLIRDYLHSLSLKNSNMQLQKMINYDNEEYFYVYIPTEDDEVDDVITYTLSVLEV